MMESSETSGLLKGVLNYVAGALLMVCIGVVGFQQSQINKMDDRIYQLQATTVTEDKLNAAMSKLSVDMDNKIGNLKNEQALTNKFLERVIDRMEQERLSKK